MRHAKGWGILINTVKQIHVCKLTHIEYPSRLSRSSNSLDLFSFVFGTGNWDMCYLCRVSNPIQNLTAYFKTWQTMWNFIIMIKTQFYLKYFIPWSKFSTPALSIHLTTHSINSQTALKEQIKREMCLKKRARLNLIMSSSRGRHRGRWVTTNYLDDTP